MKKKMDDTINAQIASGTPIKPPKDMATGEAVYFIYKDASTYPKIKKRLREMEKRASELAENTQSHVYILDADFEGTEEFGAEE